MKVFASTLLLLIMAGCSSDDVSEVLSADSSAASDHYYKKQDIQAPENPANPQDYTGQIYFGLLEEYYKLDPTDLTLQQVISQGEALAFLNPDFLSLDGIESYEPVTVSDILPYQVIEGQDIRLHLAAGYGPAAREIYAMLNDELTQLKAKDATYQEVHEVIVETEANIISAQDISMPERTAMLVTTSVMRNALHHDGKRRRRDRDWEWMTGHVVATANASLESIPEAIIISFATDVY